MQTHTLCLDNDVACTHAANIPPVPQTHLSMGTIKSMKFEHAALTKKALLFLRKQKLGEKNEFFNLERAAPRLTDTQNNHILLQIPVAGTGRAHLRPSTGYSEKEVWKSVLYCPPSKRGPFQPTKHPKGLPETYRAAPLPLMKVCTCRSKKPALQFSNKPVHHQR